MPLPSSLALTTIADGSLIVAADHRNNYTAIQTNTNQTLGVLGAAWSSYSPVWTASISGPSLGNGTLTGKYLQIGKFVTVQLRLSPGTTTTFGSGYFLFSLPVTSVSPTQSVIGSGYIFDTSANSIWTTVVDHVDTGHARPLVTAVATYEVGANQPFTWASGDGLNLAFTYEAA